MPKGQPTILEAFGERKNIKQWSEDPRCPVSKHQLAERVRKGWDHEAAITTSIKPRRPPVTAFGETKSLMEWSRDPRCVVDRKLLVARLDDGWEPERALTYRERKRWDDIEAFGEKKSIKQWSEDPRCVVPGETLRTRLTSGWSPEDAISSTLQELRNQSAPKHEAFGESKTLSDWIGDPRCVVSLPTLCKRLSAGTPLQTALTTLVEEMVSAGEALICSWLDEVGIRYERHNREVISPKEIDIWIPDHRLGIEHHGLHWHSERFAGKTEAQEKWRLSQQAGIRLLQIYEDDLLDKPGVVRSMILHRLGFSSEKVHARKTSARALTADEAKSLLNAHHIQGFVGCTAYTGLVVEGRVVACMGLQETNGRWVLSRYATACSVPGGFSKLLRWSLQKHQIDSLVTFADLTTSNGDLYLQNGFHIDGLVEPDYSYIVGKRRYHKFSFRKARFKEDPNLKYEEGLTERELADLNGIDRIWDAGKIRFVYRT